MQRFTTSNAGIRPIGIGQLYTEARRHWWALSVQHTVMCHACWIGVLTPIATGSILPIILVTMFHASVAQAQDRATLVAVSKVVRREVTQEVSLVATVTPRRRSTIGSAVAGRVEEFLGVGSDGQAKLTRVAKGQPLAKLRTRTTKIELEVAKAQHESLKQQLAELENGARPEEKAASLAKQKSAKARTEYANAKYQRSRLLFEQNKTVSREQLDLALAEAVEAEQSYQEATAQHNLVLAGPRPERIAQMAAQVTAQQETINRLEDILSKYEIRAPFNGYVVAEFTEVGAWLAQGDPVAEIIQLDTVEIETFVPEVYISSLRVGRNVPFTIDALPGRTFSGTIERIVPQADVSRTFPVKIKADNPRLEESHLLKAGMLGRVQLALGTAESVLMVPKDALVFDRTKPSLFIVENNGGESRTVKSVDVDIGVSDGTWIEIEGPVQEEELVVVEGNERLHHGQVVRLIENEE